MHKRRVVSGALVGAVAASLSFSGYLTGAAQADTNPTWITGFVVDEGGTPVADVPIFVYAWPTDAATDAAAPNTQIPWTIVDTSMTDVYGDFSLPQIDPSMVVGDVNPDGLVDYTVVAAEPEMGLEDWDFQAAPDDQSVITPPTIALPNYVAEIESDVSSVEDPDVTSAVGEAEYVAADAVASKKVGPCVITDLGDLGNRDVDLGYSYNESNHAKQKFTFTASGTAKLGEGSSLGGQYGSWKQYDTSTTEASDSLDFGTTTAYGDLQYYTQDDYHKYHSVCHFTTGNTTGYQVKPTEFVGTPQKRTASSRPTADYCGKVDPGTGFTLGEKNGNATENSDGVGLQNVIGINLSSQAGYTDSVTLTIHNTSNSQVIYACGVNGDPGSSPGEVVVWDQEPSGVTCDGTIGDAADSDLPSLPDPDRPC